MLLKMSQRYTDQPSAFLTTYLFRGLLCLALNGFVASVTKIPSDVTTFSTNGSEDCVCECQFVMAANLTLKQLKHEVQKIYNALLLDKNNISATVRKRISVPDHRPSAQSIGYVGVLVLVTSLGSIVALDFATLLKDVKTGLVNLRQMMTKSKVRQPNYKSINNRPDETVRVNLQQL